MPFRASFDCLWCGTAYAVRSAADVEGWAQLCPDCVGKAGDNGFLRYRLKLALRERAGSTGGPTVAPIGPRPATAASPPAPGGRPAGPSLDRDDWYLRRGAFSRGAIHDAAWDAELDVAGRWLDDQPLHGDIVELGGGTGWWSPLLASKGELSLYDRDASALDRARDRLLAHRLRAHLHVRDPWAEPDRLVDAVFAAMWLGAVDAEQRGDHVMLLHRWLQPGGRIALLEAGEDPAPGSVEPRIDRSSLAGWLEAAGFVDITTMDTGRFFVAGAGRATH